MHGGGADDEIACEKRGRCISGSGFEMGFGLTYTVILCRIHLTSTDVHRAAGPD